MMKISSTLLALNYQKNFEEITNAQNYLICIVDENFDSIKICEINNVLQNKALGKLFPIIHSKESSAFSIVFEDFEKLEILLKIIKRLFWESGVLLSTKIVLIEPELKVLKEYGQGECKNQRRN